MSLPLLLGECPSKPGDRYHDFPLSGAVGKRLCEFAGIEPEAEGSRYGRWYWALRGRFDCLNVMERHTSAWSEPAARDRWWKYLTVESRHVGILTVVCLGRRAARAVGLPDSTPWGDWAQVGRVRAALIPHPSGRNLLYNDPAMRDLAGRVLREAMDG